VVSRWAHPGPVVERNAEKRQDRSLTPRTLKDREISKSGEESKLNRGPRKGKKSAMGGGRSPKKTIKGVSEESGRPQTEMGAGKFVRRKGKKQLVKRIEGVTRCHKRKVTHSGWYTPRKEDWTQRSKKAEKLKRDEPAKQR